MKIYRNVFVNGKRFSEALRFSDLMKRVSMSPFTLDYNKEKNKLMGAPARNVKLVGMTIPQKKKRVKGDSSVTFIFRSNRTPKPEYKNKKIQIVDPLNFGLQDAAKDVYTIEIRILDFFNLLNTNPNKEITNKDIEEVLNVADVQIWSNVPAFQLQGMNYIMTMFDAAIHPEKRPPLRWNTLKSRPIQGIKGSGGKQHNDNQFLDKHTAGIINSIKFYIPQMRMKLKKYLGLTKQKNKNNRGSNMKEKQDKQIKVYERRFSKEELNKIKEEIREKERKKQQKIIEEKFEEAGFIVNNLASGQEALINIMKLMFTRRKSPMVFSNLIKDALTTGIDGINGDNNNKMIPQKKQILKKIIRELTIYLRTLGKDPK